MSQFLTDLVQYAAGDARALRRDDVRLVARRVDGGQRLRATAGAATSTTAAMVFRLGRIARIVSTAAAAAASTAVTARAAATPATQRTCAAAKPARRSRPGVRVARVIAAVASVKPVNTAALACTDMHTVCSNKEIITYGIVLYNFERLFGVWEKES